MTETKRLKKWRAEPIKVGGGCVYKGEAVLLVFATEASRRELVKELWDAASKFDAFPILLEDCCH